MTGDTATVGTQDDQILPGLAAALCGPAADGEGPYGERVTDESPTTDDEE